jgi:hypothetical protein
VLQQQAPVGAQGGPISTQKYSLAGVAATGRNVAKLQILHDEGFVEGAAEVSGVVTDASGAVIPEASVSLRDASDQAAREVATGPDGRFKIAGVPAGRYELRVAARGFNTTTAQVELKSRDVAMVDSVLPIGSESQTVTVEADNIPLETVPISAASAKLLESEKLPGGAAGVAREELGDRVLTIDAAGNLYLSRNAGKSWKKIKPEWNGKAVRLATLEYLAMGQMGAIDAAKPKAARAPAFLMTTDAGAAWMSEDGEHWRPQPDGQP